MEETLKLKEELYEKVRVIKSKIKKEKDVSILYELEERLTEIENDYFNIND